MKKEDYLSAEIPKEVSTAGVPPKEEIVDIIADNIDSWEEGDKRVVVAIGNVKIKKVDTTIDADSVILWFDKKEADGSTPLGQSYSEMYAEGNVTMRRKDDVLIADKIFENAKEDKGILINSQIKTKIQRQKKDKIIDASETKGRTQKSKTPLFEGMPAFVSGEEIKHVSNGTYALKNGVITTCGYGHPHYRFKGKKIRLVQRGEHNIVSSK